MIVANTYRFVFDFSDGIPNEVHIYLADVDTGTILDAISALSVTTQQIGQAMEADLTGLRSAVDSETTVIGGAVTLLDGLKATLDQIASQPTINPADIQAVADAIGSNRDNLAAAVQRNTPAAP